jgi:hypothetical protein
MDDKLVCCEVEMERKDRARVACTKRKARIVSSPRSKAVTVPVSIRLTTERAAQLLAHAEKHHLSREHFIRLAIDRCLVDGLVPGKNISGDAGDDRPAQNVVHLGNILIQLAFVLQEYVELASFEGNRSGKKRAHRLEQASALLKDAQEQLVRETSP